MRNRHIWGPLAAGLAAGSVTGLFGAGGGMVLVPALTLLTTISEDAIFPTSLSVMLPICIVSLIATAWNGHIAWMESLPYLMGSAAGGIIAGIWGRKIPAKWLHKVLGILILWGGIRNLW